MEYLIQISGGLFGMLFHIFAVKLPSYKSQCSAGNIPFKMKGYFDCDWIAIVASFITVLIAVFVFDELVATYSPIKDYIKLFMIFVGFTGSSILIAWIGRASKSALSIIDKKTNEFDALKPQQQ